MARPTQRGVAAVLSILGFLIAHSWTSLSFWRLRPVPVENGHLWDQSRHTGQCRDNRKKRKGLEGAASRHGGDSKVLVLVKITFYSFSK